MHKIFSGKKINLKDSNETTLPVDKNLLNITQGLINIISTNESIPISESETQSYKKPKYPLYCTECGYGLLKVESKCYSCGSKLDFSDRDIIDLPDELVFRACTNEDYSYKVSGLLIQLYYYSTPDFSYGEIYNLLEDLFDDYSSLDKPFSSTVMIKGLSDKIRVIPPSKKLSKEFASSMVNLSEELIKDFDDYLTGSSITDYNYKEIQSYMRRQLFDKSILGDIK